jgi:hypothetical protein
MSKIAERRLTMYEAREFQVNGHTIAVTATKIQGLHKELYAKGSVNIVLDGRTIGAGCAEGFEKLVSWEPKCPVVMAEDFEGGGRTPAPSWIFVVNDVAVKFVMKSTNLLEFAVFGFNRDTGDWDNQLLGV